jgi:hypothetical protein
VTPKILTASEILNQASAALRNGDKQAARHWAQLALTMVPNLEDPWLILAVVSNPRASIVYLERALELNPASERARKGLEWARSRRDWEQTQPIRRIKVAVPAVEEPPTQPNRAAQKGHTD